jgi:FkbM family methyltransferase
MNLDLLAPMEVLIYFNLHDWEISRAVERYVSEGARVVDVGASLGYFTLLMAYHAGPSGKVFAFEPNPIVFERLKEHLEMNMMTDRVETFKLAVGDENKPAGLSVYPGRHDISSLVGDDTLVHDVVKVDCVTLDRMYLNGQLGRPVYIKIDVEGGELAVLKGAERLIADCRPTLSLEIGQYQRTLYGYAPEVLFDWTAQRGYSVYHAHPYRGLIALTREEINSIPSGNLLAIPKSVN